jgi:hypothetical protein
LKNNGVIIVNNYDKPHIKEAMDKLETILPIKSILVGKQISYTMNK